ncbi:MAG: relaxase/mobilization nuclease domain-containing protein [Desulfosporosinus sp.]|nr:relaxase/mobilization nuclease domain-containing protein [Desulfosporosinus sp.]
MAIERVLKDEDSSKIVLNYIMNPNKTDLVTGVNCVPETAFEEMRMIKTAYNKQDGRQFVHLVQSFHPAEQVTPQQVHEIGVRLAKEFERFSGFQIVVSTHLDQNHLHNHFVLNTVNMENGLKWQQSKQEMKQVKNFSDQLCKSYGLSTIEHKEPKRESSGEYRAKQKGQSWKHELRLAVDACMKNSIGRADFMANMRRLGYETKWTDTRKDITFFTTDGKKCRIDNLNKALTKDALQESFALNKEFGDPKAMADEIRGLELATKVSNMVSVKEELIAGRDIEGEYEEDGAGDQLSKSQDISLNEHEGAKREFTRKRAKKGEQSWIVNLRLAVDACKQNSISQADFISNMRRLGYQVVWTDTRKEITFINPQGRKRRNLTLDKALTKEALHESFARNKELGDPKAMADEIRKLESAANVPNMVTIEDEIIAGQDVEGEYEEGQTKNRIEDTVMNAEEAEDTLEVVSSKEDLEDAIADLQETNYSVKWSDCYKEARAFLYGSDEIEQNFTEAYRLFLEEAQIGNALALHDLGRMHMDGLGVEMNPDIAQEWYARALIALREVEIKKPGPYTQYRIGKMYAAGLGTPQNYEEAASWFKMAAAENHKYAQYSLAGLYYRGQGVEQSFTTAFSLYQKSAAQKNVYASYEVAKMFRNGVGTEIDIVEAEKYFKNAFIGFSALEADSHDDKLQYRLGQMLYTGTGTEKDVVKAVDYLELSGKLGNVNAQYLLAKIYLEADSALKNVERALEWLGKAAENGNAQAQYALGKLYRDGNHVEKDIVKAVELFKLSAEQGNSFAQYALGKLYLADEGVPKDGIVAIKWLTLSSDLGNQFAQYSLAKLYLAGEETPKDIELAIKLLTESAEQQNQFAQYALGKLYLFGEEIPKDVEAAVKWLRASAEQENNFAQYTLGKLYIEGKEVPKDVEAGIKLFTASAEQGNPYASFELGKMYQDGLGINKDTVEAEKYFGNAFIGFSELEADSHNDKLQYRLGQMLYKGTGTEKDSVKAVDYLEQSRQAGQCECPVFTC